MKTILNKLKSLIRRKILGVDITNYFFAQAGEDAILQALFRKKLESGSPGFFVDVGAYHPYKDSNTYLLYKNNWKGINIDATPGSMEAFKKFRPRDINIEIGIGEKEGVLDYYWIDFSSTMNSFSKKNLIDNGMIDFVKKIIPIKVHALKTILLQYSSEFKKIDLLNIDVEGLDFVVLNSNDWDNFKPDVISVELSVSSFDDLSENNSAIFLKEKGYKIVAKNVILNNVATVFFVHFDFKY